MSSGKAEEGSLFLFNILLGYLDFLIWADRWDQVHISRLVLTTSPSQILCQFVVSLYCKNLRKI